MIYYAHKQEGKDSQTVLEHCTNVARMAKIFGDAFHLGALCEIAGKLHDIGKYTEEFQRRLLENGEKVDHSSAGAIEAKKEYGDAWNMALAYVIAGHHSGLQNYGSPESGLLNRLHKGDTLPDYSSFREEISFPEIHDGQEFIDSIRQEGRKNLGFRLSFMTRMIYSALVDADFLDTESYMDMNQHQLRQKYEPWPVLRERFQQHMAEKTNNVPSSEINIKRNKIYTACVEKGKGKPGLYTLTVPTGGGKTLSSMAFALEQQKNRIIYVIPYTSIIRQTAGVFREIFGEENVLEHHSNYDFYDSIKDREAAKAMHLSSENWDVPITVTTNVQFFESIFANKSSRCRKLHHLANSVIILDEAQMIPLYYLKPCLLALEELVKRYGATVVFCTATKPEFPKGILSLQPTEIINNPDGLYETFQRTNITFINEKSNKEITELIDQESCCLCIVNKRKHVSELYDASSIKPKYQLSGNMCHCHQDKILDKVKEHVNNEKAEKHCALFSTQLIECGVDISFPVVFRALSGLDSVIQAAGRCNRENELAKEHRLGEVYVFDPTSPASGLRGYQNLIASCGRRLMANSDDVNNPITIKRYFRKLYTKEEQNLDKKKILDEFNRQPDDLVFNFETAAKNFQLIDDTDSLIIPYDDKAVVLMKQFEYFPEKSTLKKLQPYAISVYPNQIEKLKGRGGVKRIGENLYFLTTKEGFYSEEAGLLIAEEMENLQF
ncbi:MAG TPA: CRISPR-associated helicase Cas3' [Clostridiales bacterium]|nr:CRISPR-associated helicase Cas3' [Clostridiales bacterium]